MDLFKFMNPAEVERTGASSLNPMQQQALLNWGMRMFNLGQHIVGDIDSVKYDGRLIVLDDGSRWEVDAVDASTSDLWDSSDRVVVIDDEMYRLDDLEKVSVTLED